MKFIHHQRRNRHICLLLNKCKRDFRTSLDLIMAIFILRTVNSSFFIYSSHFVININLEKRWVQKRWVHGTDRQVSGSKFSSKETSKSFMPKTTHQFELPVIVPNFYLQVITKKGKSEMTHPQYTKDSQCCIVIA